MLSHVLPDEHSVFPEEVELQAVLERDTFHPSSSLEPTAPTRILRFGWFPPSISLEKQFQIPRRGRETRIPNNWRDDFLKIKIPPSPPFSLGDHVVHNTHEKFSVTHAE